VTKYAAVCVAVLTICGCASLERVANPDADISKVIDVDKSKGAIFDLTMQFIAENFKSAKSVIEYQDREAGRIVGNGTTFVSDGMMDRPASFTMIIDIKDKKFRVTYKSLRYQAGTALPWGPIEYVTPYNSMVGQLDGITDHLRRYVESSAETSDF
jgi:hypothetical protein